jgi:CubicO group peptidase (beta-lactamase class C family)
MKTSFAVLLLSSALCDASQHASKSLPRSTPEAEGISSAAILSFIETADQQVNEMNSFMLIRHGKVVAEGWWAPYSAEDPHVLYSLSKSFTSTAVGLAVNEGKLSIDDEVLKFFPEDAPTNAANNLKAMRVRDLLCMSTGHQTEPRLTPEAEEPWTKLFLAHPVPHKPGTHFLYNTAATYMQSAIVQKVTGQTVLDYLTPRLFDPLGIVNATWGTSPQGVSLGGYGLNLKTEDIARFGQLYLQKGKWNEKQLVPADWIEMATSKQTSNGSNPKSDWDQGYGFQFWRCQNGAYRGDGAFGQYCIVMPKQDAVVAITSGTRDMQRVLNLLWDKLLPGFDAKGNKEAQRALKERLGHLSLRFPEGAANSPNAAKWNAKRYVFPANAQKLESIMLQTQERGTRLTLGLDGKEQHIDVGSGAWRKGKLTIGTFKDAPIAASGAWKDENTYVLKICFYESPTTLTVALKNEGEELRCDAEYNVAFGPTKQPQLVGKLAN